MKSVSADRPMQKEYLRRAAAAWQSASETTDTCRKSRWLALAAQWVRLAEFSLRSADPAALLHRDGRSYDSSSVEYAQAEDPEL